MAAVGWVVAAWEEGWGTERGMSAKLRCSAGLTCRSMEWWQAASAQPEIFRRCCHRRHRQSSTRRASAWAVSVQLAWEGEGMAAAGWVVAAWEEGWGTEKGMSAKLRCQARQCSQVGHTHRRANMEASLKCAGKSCTNTLSKSCTHACSSCEQQLAWEGEAMAAVGLGAVGLAEGCGAERGMSAKLRCQARQCRQDWRTLAPMPCKVGKLNNRVPAAAGKSCIIRRFA
jgi:hypothetical protein